MNEFNIEDIDGSEFVESRNEEKMIISFDVDVTTGRHTGKVLVVYDDGSKTAISKEKVQNYINSGEWIIVR